MKSIDISPELWPTFCEDFSRQHRGWLVTTSVLDGVSQTPLPERDQCHIHPTARDLPFAGLTLEPNGQDLVLLLGEGKLHVSEPIHRVRRIVMLETDDGAHAGVRIEKSDETGVLVRFRVPAHPERLNGVAASER